mmetsp:Transcript_9860/g.16743  ORF Transcript_9860/g.16743 Transcript_9860/m.16743 type:complete len:112 (+) Transcript_9860:126-461(+)
MLVRRLSETGVIGVSCIDEHGQTVVAGGTASANASPFLKAVADRAKELPLIGPNPTICIETDSLYVVAFHDDIFSSCLSFLNRLPCVPCRCILMKSELSCTVCIYKNASVP